MNRLMTIFAVFLSLSVATATPNGDPDLLVTFVAKGAWVGFDVGAIGVAYQHLDALRRNDVVISGSSSGSLLAALYSCYGFNDDSARRADRLAHLFDKSKIAGDNGGKIWPVILGKEIGNPRENLTPTIEMMFDSPCTANLPVVIVAANLEVNDNRRAYPGFSNTTVPLIGAGLKELNPNNMSVYHSGLLNNPSGYIGRACTYFANQKMFDALLRIPEDQRQCDLRLINGVDDLKLAINASASEPTYFFPYAEPHPEKVRLTGMPAGTQLASRTYNGGYGMTNPIQDVKRAFPRIFTFSTGRAFFSSTNNTTIHHWFLVPLNDQIKRQRWFADVEIPYNEVEWNKKPGKGGFPIQDAVADMQIGADRARDCFDGVRNCTPAETLRPGYTFGYDGTPLDRLVTRGVGALNGEHFFAVLNANGTPAMMPYAKAPHECAVRGGSVLNFTHARDISRERLGQLFPTFGCTWTDRPSSVSGMRLSYETGGFYGSHKETMSCYVLCEK